VPDPKGDLCKHPAVVTALFLGVLLYVVGEFADRSTVRLVGVALSAPAVGLGWIHVIRRRRFRRLALALGVTALLLIGVILDAAYVPDPWAWIVLTLLLLAFFGVALVLTA
jgi:hypothetical protein